MTRQYPMKMKAAWLALSVTVFSPMAVQAAGSARIDFAIGGVVASTAAGSQRALAKGAEVVSGETVRTAADGRAQLRFDDGAMVSLQPGTEFRLDNYHFSGKQDGQERGFFSLLKGGLRTITGLIGRNNRDAYKVTTTVATIGIRGTEYTIAYTGADSVAIATGEGAIEVCGGGGCAVLGSGESGVVEGANAPLRRVDFRPQLSPVQPNDLLLAQFSTSDFRSSNGSVMINANQLISGPGYAVAYAHSSQAGISGAGDAVFGENSQFLYGTNGSSSYKGVVLGESHSMDGVIGWGRWSSAEGQTPPNPPVTLTDFHYVIGKPTPVASLGVSATYDLKGFTTPTGMVSYGPVSGNLTANFTGLGTMTVAMSLSIPTSGSPLLVSTNTGITPVAVSSTFTWDPMTYVEGGGIFAGTNASHAGATYKTMGGVSGAAVFTKR